MNDVTLESFVTALASASPTPGGGGAAALAGAVGVALGNMVGSLTLGKKKYASVEADIGRLNYKSQQLRADFLALIDEDAAAFAPLAQAYSIPRDDPKRNSVMESALAAAAVPPLKIMEKVCQAIDLVAEYAEKGTAIAVSDAGSAAAICSAALESAALNVLVNTKSMTDRKSAEEINSRVEAMLREYGARAGEIYAGVKGRLANG